jgi:hypothetical protein
VSKHSDEYYLCDLCGKRVDAYDVGVVVGEPERQLCKPCIELAAKVLRFCHIPHQYQDTSLPKRLTVEDLGEKLAQAQRAADEFKHLLEAHDRRLVHLQRKLDNLT